MNKNLNESVSNTDIDVSACETAFQEVRNSLEKLEVCPKWSIWTKWSDCAVCGHSKKARKRNCTKNNLLVAKELCQEEMSDKETDEEQICPFTSCDFTPWKDKTSCSATCGLGVKRQVRECKGSRDDCSGATTQMTTCEIRPCPSWTRWSAWSRCSKSCGNGSKTRTRTCVRNTCSKTESDIEFCNLRGCELIHM